MKPSPIERELLVEQLRDLGVLPGAVLLVHTAFSKAGPVEGGPIGLIEALRIALGPGGTLVMPSMSWDDDHPFDPQQTPCPEMGVVADTFWRLPGVLRSDSPHAFAAEGPLAEKITAAHPIEPPHGLDSPVGRLLEIDGWVLLLGIGHQANTTIHLGEGLAGVRYRQQKHVTVLQDGSPTRIAYSEIDHCCQNFRLVDVWLEQEHPQRRGQVGYGQARLARSADIVQVVTDHLRADETAFLHTPGRCGECDQAWRSLRSGRRAAAG